MRSGVTTYLGLESGASQLTFYQPMIVPGLLQLIDYARAIEQPFLPSDTPAVVERRVKVRLRRSAILTRQHNPIAAEFILHECVLHTVIGSRELMAAQLRHIADMSTRPNITVRILPFAAGFPGNMAPVMPYVILDFPADSRSFGTEPPVIYAEHSLGAMFFEDDADVQRCREIHNSLRGGTLDEQASRDLLRQVARRYDQ